MQALAQSAAPAPAFEVLHVTRNADGTVEVMLHRQCTAPVR
jgi:hypothetical protein